jgi:hypothetical protein
MKRFIYTLRLKFPVFISAVLLLALIFAQGCTKNHMIDYGDEAYLKEYEGLSLEDAYKLLKSRYTDERIIALRIISLKVAALNEIADFISARKAVGIIIDHYASENDREVRSFLVEVTLRECGLNSGAVKDFLSYRIAEGDEAREAIYTYASLFPEKYRELFFQLWLHPDFSIKYHSAIMFISVIENKGDIERFKSLLKKEDWGKWPEMISGMPLAQCKKNLSSRIKATEISFGE